jgi:cell division FtsZ-interacting protein ZapD
MPTARIYLDEDTYKKWLDLPKGRRSDIVQKVLNDLDPLRLLETETDSLATLPTFNRS